MSRRGGAGLAGTACMPCMHVGVCAAWPPTHVCTSPAGPLGWVVEKEFRNLEVLHGQSDLSSWCAPAAHQRGRRLGGQCSVPARPALALAAAAAAACWGFSGVASR